MAAIKTGWHKVVAWTEKAFRADIAYLIQGNIWLNLLKATGIISGFTLSYALANLLPQEQYGHYAYVLAIISFISTPFVSGIGTALIHRIARGEDGLVFHAYKKSFRWTSYASILVGMIAGYYFIRGNPWLGTSFLVGAICIPFLNATGLFKSFLQIKRDFRWLAISSFPRNFIPIGTMILAAAMTRNATWILVAYFGTNTLVSAYYYWRTVRAYKISPLETQTDATFSYAKHSGLISLITQLSEQIDNFLLWHFATPAQVAIYALALAAPKELKGIVDNLSTLALPKFAARDFEDVRKNLNLRINQLYVIAIPITIIYIVLAPLFFEIFFPKYLDSVFFSQIAALTILLAPRNLVETAVIAHEKLEKRYILTLVYNGLRILFAVSLVPFYGIYGAVIGLVLASLMNFLVLGKIVKYT